MNKALLSIAGFDPTGGAGILLDLKVFQQLGYQGMAAITAQTVQNTQELVSIRQLSPGLIWSQYHTLSRDVDIQGIKVGMLGFSDNIEILERILVENPSIPKVIDPVFQASSGAWLLPRASIPEFMRSIRGRASLITPNLDEASLITGKVVQDLSAMEQAAKQIFNDFKIPVLIKGGHLATQVTDLFYAGKHVFTFDNKRLAANVHGTGCCLSSAILCFLAAEHSLLDACREAIAFTQTMLETSRAVGKGQRMFVFPN